LGVIVLIYNLDVEVQKNKQSFFTTAKEIVGMVDVDAFFLVQIVVGICWGWHRSFFPVYVDLEIEDSKILFGLNFALIVNWTEFVERLGLNRFSHELQELLPVLVESVQ
jgi:hypothetical protein